MYLVNAARSRLEWVLSLFHRRDTIAPRGITGPVTDAPRVAHDLYDRLNSSPDTMIDLPRPGGGNLRTSVARLSLLSGDHESRKTELERTLDAFIRDGLFTRTKLPASDRTAMLVGSWLGNRGSLERDALLYDADRCLEFPAPLRNGALEGYSSNDPRALPEWFPGVRLTSPVYPTPRILDSRGFPDSVLRARYEALLQALHRHLQARNTALRFHPAVIAMTQGHKVDVRFANPDLWYPFSAWRSANGNPEYFDAIQSPHAVVGSDPNQGWTFTNSALWSQSLARRTQAVVLGDAAGGPYDVVTQGVYELGSQAMGFRCRVSDALVDITRAVNAAGHIIATDAVSDAQRVLVDMQAAAQVSRFLRVLAHRHAAIPMGQNITEALQAAALERGAMYNRQRTQSLGIDGYVSVGDDGADITALTIDSLSLAFSGGMAVAAANPIAGVAVGVCLFVVRFATGLVMLFASPDRPRDPVALPFRVKRGDDTPWQSPRGSIVIPGMTYSQAMLDVPYYRGV